MTISAAEIDALKALIHEYKANCDHGKNNLTHQVGILAERLGQTQAMHQQMQISLQNLDSVVSKGFRDVADAIGTINVNMALNGANHKNNGYLIKWLMGICSAVLIACIGGMIGFALKR